jgi:hypothetical protein
MCMNSFPTETLPLGLPPDTLGIKFPTHTFGATFKLQWGGGQRKGGGRAAFLSGGSRGECLLAFCSFWSCPLPGLVTSAFIFEALRAGGGSLMLPSLRFSPVAKWSHFYKL